MFVQINIIIMAEYGCSNYEIIYVASAQNCNSYIYK